MMVVEGKDWNSCRQPSIITYGQIWEVSHLSREKDASHRLLTELVNMAATAPTQGQQGVTKTLSGPNAVFKDKVYNF
jgi:hypothetical protein